jgi:acetyl-CoA carboxylase biotin carboxyl carrier protein
MSDKFNIDKEAITQLAEILEETGLLEIEYEDGGRRVRVVRDSQQQMTMFAPSPTFVAPTAIVESPQVSLQNHPGLLRSPMVGTAYTSSEPGAPPFVKVGDTINIGQTLLIIEAMKVMNPIKAQRAGKVTQVLVRDAMPVEFGEPLLVIE